MSGGGGGGGGLRKGTHIQPYSLCGTFEVVSLILVGRCALMVPYANNAHQTGQREPSFNGGATANCHFWEAHLLPLLGGTSL